MNDKELDAVNVLIEEGWIWDGDQWQRPLKRKWQHLTENELRDIQMDLQKTRSSGWLSFSVAIENKLKEKNHGI
jgi:hypothetical protein